MAPKTRAQLWIDGGLVFGWAGLIWVLGGGEFSASDTSRILGPLIEWLFPDWSAADRGLWVGAIRKLAHPIEYGVFAVLALRFIHALRPDASVSLACMLSVAAAAGLASFDELRQGGLANRTGSPFDVGLDVFGAVIALITAVGVATSMGGRWLGVPGFGRAIGLAGGPKPPSPPPTA